MNVEMYEKYKPYRQELNTIFYTDKNYELCLRRTKEFNDLLVQDGVMDKYNYHFTYMMYSKIYNKFNNIAHAIKYAILAEQFATNDSDLNYAHWQLANCYFYINKNKVLYYYDLCEEYYKNTNEEFCLAQIKSNKALLLKDDKLMLNTVKLYNKRNINVSKYGYKNIDELNDENYEILFDIYTKGHFHNSHFMAWNVLHKIKNKNLKQKLSNLLLSNQAIG